ncbi:MAG: hypothetical protein EBU83_01065, partial [bacterium]|nr:hypothetical protein [Candidatus Aquidulcis sp.]
DRRAAGQRERDLGRAGLVVHVLVDEGADGAGIEQRGAEGGEERRLAGLRGTRHDGAVPLSALRGRVLFRLGPRGRRGPIPPLR